MKHFASALIPFLILLCIVIALVKYPPRAVLDKQIANPFTTFVDIEGRSARAEKITKQTTTLSLGEEVVFNDTKIVINKVVEDSRCPEGVMCIQKGRVVIEIEAIDDVAEKKEMILLEEGSDFYISNTHVVFKEVSPYPSVDVLIHKAEYRFELFLEVVE